MYTARHAGTPGAGPNLNFKTSNSEPALPASHSNCSDGNWDWAPDLFASDQPQPFFVAGRCFFRQV